MPMGIGLGIGVTRGGGVGWWPAGSELALEFDNQRGFNSIDRTKTTPDSILTYTNPSAKLVYGSDGVLRYAPHNLLTYSENINQGQWLATNITINSSTQFTFNTDAGYFRRGLNPVPKNKYELAVELSGSHPGDTFRLELVDSVDGSDSNFIDVVVPSSPTEFTVAADMTTATFSGALLVAINRTAAGRSITAGSTVTITRMHLRYTPSDATYIPTTTAAVYSLPIDHNPTTFEPLGVLIEEQRVNLLQWSEQFNDAAWSKSDATVTANAAVAPNGTTTADKLIPNAAATNGRAIQVVAGTIGATYTLTVFGKQGEFTNCRLYADDGGSNVASVSYNLSTGVVSTAAAVSGGNWTAVSTTITPSYDPSYDGYYRMSLTWTATTVAPSRYGVWCRDTGDGTSGIYIWGAQLEAGAFATSYIPTTNNPLGVTRLADQVSILTSAFAYNAAAGTVAVQGSGIRGVDSRYVSIINVSTNARTIDVFSPAGVTVRTYSDAAGFLDPSPNSIAALSENKVAAAYKLNDYAVALNGGSVSVDTTTAALPTADVMRIGQYTAQQPNGTIKRLTYFPTRRSNADLQVLTT